MGEVVKAVVETAMLSIVPGSPLKPESSEFKRKRVTTRVEHGSSPQAGLGALGLLCVP